MNFKGIVWIGVNWIHVAVDKGYSRPVVNTVMNLLNFIKCGEFIGKVLADLE
jgi:hypothetical protein